MHWRCYFTALLGLHLVCASVTHAREIERTLTNPVLPAGQDPWVVQWQGEYYLCQSRGAAGISVSRSGNLSGIGQTNWVTVWTPPPDTAWSKNIWAPEIHFLRGRWYLYFAADDGENANHRMYVLEGSSRSPQDPFRFLGKVAALTDRWAIDGTVLEMPDGALYFIWSGWEGFENVAQNIYIAPMSDPWTISGERVLLSRPEFDWEKNGRPLVNEAPQVLWNGPNLFVIYSASGSWTDDHCLGQLRWRGGDPLDSNSWVKHPSPIFARTDQVFGPGHPSFVKSPDGKEDWIIYHSARSQGAGWRRQINMQPFTWKPDGSPDFGSPIAPGVLIPAPSGDHVPAPALAPVSAD
jgi:GH43 family beta-xylosidase